MAKLNKFEQESSMGDKGLLNKRGKAIANQAELQNKAEIQASETNLNNIQMEIIEHTDLGRLNSQDLSAQKLENTWAKDLKALKIRELEATIELEIDNKIKKEWFTKEEV